jgi:enoyl-CoA hydratase
MTLDGRVALQVVDGIANIVIDRPEKRNALSLAMWRSIPPLVARINADTDIRGVVITGAGDEAFAAGADIAELEECIDRPANGLAYMLAVEAAESAINRCERPVVAMIRGHCVGAGVEIAMACDRRVATPDSLFAIPPSKLGVTYSLSSTRRVAMLIGFPAAKDLMYTARQVEADEALNLGLIDEIVSREDLVDHVHAYIERIGRNSSFSVRATKVILEAIRNGATEESEAIKSLRLSGFSDPDFKEGMASFREKRRANFSLRHRS